MTMYDYYFAGNYARLLKEFADNKSNDGQFMILRSELMVGHVDFVIKQTANADASPVYPGINLLANVIKSGDNKKDYISEHVDDQLKITNQYYSACLAVAYLLADQKEDAIETIARSQFFEAPLIKAQCYLAFNRLDLVEECVSEAKNDTLKHILIALVAIHKDPQQMKNGDQITLLNATNFLLDKADIHGMTPLLSSLISSLYFISGEADSAIKTINDTTPDPTTDINKAVYEFPTSELNKIQSEIDRITSTPSAYANKIKELNDEFDTAAQEIKSE